MPQIVLLVSDELTTENRLEIEQYFIGLSRHIRTLALRLHN